MISKEITVNLSAYLDGYLNHQEEPSAPVEKPSILIKSYLKHLDKQFYNNKLIILTEKYFKTEFMDYYKKTNNIKKDLKYDTIFQKCYQQLRSAVCTLTCGFQDGSTEKIIYKNLEA